MAKTQEIKDLLAVAAGLPTPAMNVNDFDVAASNGDLAKVQLAVETHKLDPNACTGVSADCSFYFPPLPLLTAILFPPLTFVSLSPVCVL